MNDCTNCKNRFRCISAPGDYLCATKGHYDKEKIIGVQWPWMKRQARKWGLTHKSSSSSSSSSSSRSSLSSSSWSSTWLNPQVQIVDYEPINGKYNYD